MGKKNNKKESTETKVHETQFELDNDFNQYIREISRNLYNEQNNDDESRILLINNFIEAIPDNQFEAVAQHGLGSKVIDSLIGFSSSENFEKFTSNLSSRKLYTDIKSTFVLECCMRIATIRALANESIKDESSVDDEPATKKGKYVKRSTDIEYNLKLDVKPEHIQYCNELVMRLSKFVLNNIEDLLKSQGNHFVRTCLLSLSGIINIKSHDRNAPNQINLVTDYQKTINPEWIEIACDFATRIIQWPQFADLAFDEKSSTFLQILCQVLHNIKQQDTLKKLIKAIMKKCFMDEEEEGQEEASDEKNFEILKPFTNRSAQFLLESVIQYCDEKQFLKIYNRYFKDYIVQMSDTSFNFTVQRLIDAVKNKEIFEEIFNQLTPQFSNLLQNGKTGVVLAICKACDRLSFKQGQFIQSLLRCLECEKSPNFTIQCITNLMPLKVIEQKTEVDVHLHGSLILQHILKFNKPIKIVQNLLDMKPQHLSDIFCHPKGSRIADAFLESKFIGEKSREKLIKHLEGMYLKMALSRNGSHVLEKLYNISSDGQKEEIVKEISERMNQINSSQSGKIVAYKFNVEMYSRNPNQWRNFLSRSAK
ncbi:nucleolar protein 9 [Chironomus tepperi]|uniref:nucleolar protein 9 n=1 Tax=Chironomus tepperi TaxID=113505 RepID=UPI00391F19A6